MILKPPVFLERNMLRLSIAIDTSRSTESRLNFRARIELRKRL